MFSFHNILINTRTEEHNYESILMNAKSVSTVRLPTSIYILGFAFSTSLVLTVQDRKKLNKGEPTSNFLLVTEKLQEVQKVIPFTSFSLSLKVQVPMKNTQNIIQVGNVSIVFLPANFALCFHTQILCKCRCTMLYPQIYVLNL